MLAIPISLLTILIILEDVKFHKIRNISNLVLLIFLLVDGNFLPISQAFIAIATTAFFLLIVKAGMGDVKLMIVLISSQGALVISARYGVLLLMILILHLSIHHIREGSIRGNIALAPTILAPFLFTYLAM